MDPKVLIQTEIDSICEQAEIDSICEEEGFRRYIYQDSLGNETIGHGLTWLSEYESRMIVSHRMPELVNKMIEAHLILNDRPVEVTMITVHMSYQLGLAGVGAFRKMWAAITAEDYEAAADEMLDSKWHKQTPSRVQRLSDRMRAVKQDGDDRMLALEP